MISGSGVAGPAAGAGSGTGAATWAAAGALTPTSTGSAVHHAILLRKLIVPPPD